MLELGQPLHAFDYDVLVRRAKNKPPTIITRRAERGEVLTTLDGVERKLDEFTELVCDTAGSLSIAGVMGGMESEISDKTTSVLLEGASWNFINIRKTVASQKIPSEAAYRFSRGVHPTLAEQGVLRCLELIRQWSDGVVCKGLVDAYPQPVRAIPVEISVEDVKRILNIDLSLTEMASILAKLEFTCDVKGDRLSVLPPENRLDIGTGQVGKADLLEEIARIYHYDRIPERMPLDEIPPAASNPPMQMTEKIRDVLTQMGLQEVISYRLTSVEREARTIPYPEKWKPDYIRIVNPSTPDRCVMRRSILASILDCIEKNARQADSQQLFEIGSVYVPEPDQVLPAETRQLAIGLSGLRNPIAWDSKDRANFDFFDLKGFLEGLLTNLGIKEFRIRQEEHASYHPGKCAGVWVDDTQVGIFGEIHPLVRNHYEFGDTPVQAGVFDMEKLIQLSGNQSLLEPLPMYPPILEDLAVIIDETIPAETVVDVIRKAGGSVVKSIRLFDVFHGAQIGEGKKSLAYSIVYQSADRTLTDEDIRGTRNRIIKTLEQELKAKLRS
jgi:phenylalanyl-tRNA synthetase beta chain